MRTIIMDSETTGLPQPSGTPVALQPKIIEFAAIKIDEDLNEVCRMEFLCDPGHEISDIITKITGLKTVDVEGKPPFSARYAELCDFFLGTEGIVAHNLAFDLTMMRFEMERMGKVTAFPWPPKQICTVEKSFHIHGHRLNLTKLHKLATGEDHINNAHRAMADVEALLKCYKWLHSEGKL